MHCSPSYRISQFNLALRNFLLDQGSLCTQMGSSILAAGVPTIVLFVIPSVLAISVLSFLTIRYIKKNTISK